MNNSIVHQMQLSIGILTLEMEVFLFWLTLLTVAFQEHGLASAQQLLDGQMHFLATLLV